MQNPFNLKLSIIILGIFCDYTYAQVAISNDGAAPSPAAQLEVRSSNKGLLLPRLANTAAVAAPTAGLLVYDQSQSAPSYYNGNSWQSMTSGLAAQYSNTVAFAGNTSLNSSLFTWQVPVGVTKIWVEAWSGGNSGDFIPDPFVENTPIKGGRAGGFLSAIVSVLPQETLNIYVGNGNIDGEGGATVLERASDISQFFYLQNTFFQMPSSNNSGLLMAITGEEGQPETETYGVFNSTSFRRTFSGGKGGTAYPNQPGGNGTTATYANNLMVNCFSVKGNAGVFPGGGGGVGYGSAANKGVGAGGLVIIHW